MACHAAAARENTGDLADGFHILGRGLDPHENNAFTLFGEADCIVRPEDGSTRDSTGACWQTLRDNTSPFINIHTRVKKPYQALWVNSLQRLLFGDEALSDKVHCDFDSCSAVRFAGLV